MKKTFGFLSVALLLFCFVACANAVPSPSSTPIKTPSPIADPAVYGVQFESTKSLSLSFPRSRTANMFSVKA